MVWKEKPMAVGNTAVYKMCSMLALTASRVYPGKSTAYHQLAEGKDHTAACSDVMVQGHYLEGIDHR